MGRKRISSSSSSFETRYNLRTKSLDSDKLYKNYKNSYKRRRLSNITSSICSENESINSIENEEEIEIELCLGKSSSNLTADDASSDVSEESWKPLTRSTRLKQRKMNGLSVLRSKERRDEEESGEILSSKKELHPRRCASRYRFVNPSGIRTQTTSGWVDPTLEDWIKLKINLSDSNVNKGVNTRNTNSNEINRVKIKPASSKTRETKSDVVCPLVERVDDEEFIVREESNVDIGLGKKSIKNVDQGQYGMSYVLNAADEEFLSNLNRKNKKREVDAFTAERIFEIFEVEFFNLLKSEKVVKPSGNIVPKGKHKTSACKLFKYYSKTEMAKILDMKQVEKALIGKVKKSSKIRKTKTTAENSGDKKMSALGLSKEKQQIANDNLAPLYNYWKIKRKDGPLLRIFQQNKLLYNWTTD